MSRRWFWIFFVGLVLLAAGLRLWQLGTIPVSVYWDEVAMLVDIKSVLATGLDMHGRPWYQLIYPSYGDYKLPVYIWAATLTSKLFGYSEFSLRLPSAIAGVFTVIVSGALVRVLLEKATRTKYAPKFLDVTQLLTMLVVTLSPWSLMFSRTAFEGHLGQVLLAGSILMTAWGFAGNTKLKQLAFWFAPALAALATYTYYSVRFVWVLVYVLLCGLLILQKYLALHQAPLKRVLSLKSLIVKSVVGLLIFGVLLIPLLKSPLAKDADRFRLGTDSVLNNDQLVLQSNLYKELAGNKPIDRIFYNSYWLMARELLKNYSDNLSPAFLFLNGDPNLRHGTGQFGLFLLIFAPALLTGLVVLLKRHTFLALFLGVWWLVALLPASVPENTPHALRSLNALVPLSVMIGFGLSWWWSALHSNVWRSLIGVIIFVSFAQFWWFYLSVYPKISANDWQSGYKNVALEVANQTNTGKTVYFQPFDDRFYLWLMAYGPYTPADFHSWSSENYKFATTKLTTNFKGVDFSSPSDEEFGKLVKEGRQPVLIGETESIEKRCGQAEEFTCLEVGLADEVGAPKFEIARLVPHLQPTP